MICRYYNPRGYPTVFLNMTGLRLLVVGAMLN